MLLPPGVRIWEEPEGYIPARNPDGEEGTILPDSVQEAKKPMIKEGL
jgi:hypothetical protein